MQVQQTCGRRCFPALLKEIQSTWLLSRRIVKILLQFWLFSCHEQNQVPGIRTQFMKMYERCRMRVLELFVTCHTDGRQKSNTTHCRPMSLNICSGPCNAVCRLSRNTQGLLLIYSTGQVGLEIKLRTAAFGERNF